MRTDTSNIVIRNRRASHDYEFLEKLIAGIKLTGTEIKSIRAGKATLTDSFCAFRRRRTVRHRDAYFRVLLGQPEQP
ncbi:MAG: SsrA-binding protein [Marinilabiliales bacterium]|nr:SsrA-binding protein [Marinilabiliales bacterium]